MDNVIVKANSLISASYSLSLVEQRLLLLAIIAARKNNISITDNRHLLVSATLYEQQFHVARQAAYMALKEACNTLFERRFSFEERNGKVKQVKSRWVQRIAYIEEYAEVEIMFASDVIPLITELENRFTQYELEQISGLSSAYGVRLYELLIQWRNAGKTPIFPLEEFRKKIGVINNEYSKMTDFKRRVLNLAITQINKNTDITVDYKQYKQGRVITGFSFQFKQKKRRKPLDPSVKDQNTTNTFYNLTDAQINSFGNQLSQLQELSYLANTGESYSDLAIRIKNMLKDPQTQPLLHPYLKQLGFSKKGNLKS